jgi:cytochrome c oxidase assembly protein subunit 15
MKVTSLHRFAVLLAALTLFLVVAGASVVSKQAGLSVPDWPLSYGKVMPEMKGLVFYEHGHRMVATLVGFFTVVLCIWLWAAEKRLWMKMLGTIALFAVIVQGVLGGLTVLYQLPPLVSIGHATLAQLFFCLTCAVALFTSPSWLQGPEHVQDAGTPSLRMLGWLAPFSVLIQLVLGAAYRHKVMSVLPHVFGAIAVAGLLLYACLIIHEQYGKHAALLRSANWLLWITIAQVTLGVIALLARLVTAQSAHPENWMVIFTTLHTATGAMTMGAAVLFGIQVYRHVQPAYAAVPVERHA